MHIDTIINNRFFGSKGKVHEISKDEFDIYVKVNPSALVQEGDYIGLAKWFGMGDTRYLKAGV